MSDLYFPDPMFYPGQYPMSNPYMMYPPWMMKNPADDEIEKNMEKFLKLQLLQNKIKNNNNPPPKKPNKFNAYKELLSCVDEINEKRKVHDSGTPGYQRRNKYDEIKEDIYMNSYRNDPSHQYRKSSKSDAIYKTMFSKPYSGKPRKEFGDYDINDLILPRQNNNNNNNNNNN
jgi:hypothetical protein